MNDNGDQSRVSTATVDELAAAGNAVPMEDRPAVPMRHDAAPGAPIVVSETSGVAAAEATGKLRVDNDVPPGATAGSG